MKMYMKNRKGDISFDGGDGGRNIIHANLKSRGDI